MKNTTILFTIAMLLAACAGQADLPTVTTDEVTAITYNSATVNATVTDDGGAPVEARGVCYSQSGFKTETSIGACHNGNPSFLRRHYIQIKVWHA